MDRRDTLLLVDDMEVNRAILRGLFEDAYNLLEAENGDQAMLLLDQYHGSIAAVLLDVVMPVKNGYEVLAEMGEKDMLSEVPVVVITAEGSAENEVRAFDLGASDIIMKPFEPYVIKRRVQNIVDLYRHKLHLEELVAEQAESLRQSNEVMVDALSSVIEYRSLESGQHILRIRMFTKILLEDLARSYPEYDLDERRIALIASAAAMHDIGKIAIPDSILNKPGPLTQEEFEIMKTHSVKGCEILAELDRMSDKEYLRYAYNICRYHHERWDGRGYPDGLKGDNIPVCAQAVGLADAYDALTTDRVYKKAFTHEKAMNMILNGECGQFSPRILECFKNVRNRFAQLAKAYADGRSPKADRFELSTSDPVHRDEKLDTLQLSQVKYFTLLRYVNATVLEVDLDNGVYHLVYAPNPDFELLRTGSSFEESVRNLVQGAVHPDDRGMVLDILKSYVDGFFEEGFLKRTRRYRVYCAASGDYRWYDATMLRIDTGDPKSHKTLIVWRQNQTGGEGGDRTGALRIGYQEAVMRNLLGGVQRCRNDKWYTLAGVSDGFKGLLGYTAEEIHERFHGRLLEIVCPEDRDEVHKRTREQLLRGNSVELEYRVRHKDGRVLWVLEKSQLAEEEDGLEYLYCMLVDVTQTKQAQEELRLSLERHQIIMDQTNDIIFEWDIASDEVVYSANWEKKFGYDPITRTVSERIPVASHLHPEDRPAFMEKLNALWAGSPYEETEVRIAKADGRYLWCRIRATAQTGEDGGPFKAVGVILDIDGEKRAAQALQDKAERDALTKLYNKNFARRKVEEYLSVRPRRERAALLIVDVDNFKQVNDRFGHMFGDAVLTEIAEEIGRLFRSEDIISRIGGDEFLIFFKAIPDQALVEDRCVRLIGAIQSMFRESLPDCKLSCSIGVSLAPEHGAAFQELFQRADRALYRAKNQGKDRFSVYAGAEGEGGFSSGEPGTAVSTRIESDEPLSLTENSLVQYTLRLLYESGDVSATVSAILELVGRQFNVSRTYIFENDPENRRCINTFEWCNQGVAPQQGRLQDLSYQEDLGGGYGDNFDENGVFYCPDTTKLPKRQYEILALRGVKSMLQCAIRDNGVFRGFVGFDECVVNRLWTQEQIDALTFLSELLSVFLLKKRAQDEMTERADDLRMVLDNQNAWIYVIDPDSYELKYINEKTYAIAPGARTGMTCHMAFFGRETPCAHCPARNIRQTVNRTQEVYNPLLKVWSSADASLIRWGGREACLLTCHDITPYKEPPQP